MTVTTIANEATMLKDIWDSLTGSSIAFEIENQNIEETSTVYGNIQSSGTLKGSWNNIPPTMVQECGTQHDGIFHGNLGGVIYEIRPGIYFGVAWADPNVGSAQFFCELGDEASVAPRIMRYWDTWFNAYPISGTASFSCNYGGITAFIQPGFDPFKVTFLMTPSNEGNSSEPCLPGEPTEIDPSELNQEEITSEQLAIKHEKLGKALIESSKRLRGM